MRRRLALTLAAIVLSTGILTACGSDAPPVYRGGECPLSRQITDAWAGTGDEHWAVDVAIRESRCQPEARNPSGASGVFQLMMPLHARLVYDVCGHGDVFDPACNIAAARALYDGSGRAPWGY